MAFIRKNINLLFVFILPAYFYIVQNSIQNKHTHVYASGIVVTHSHPVDQESDAPINEHNHTKTEINLFSTLHFDLYDVPELAGLSVNLCELHTSYFIPDGCHIFEPVFLKTIPRGPPA